METDEAKEQMKVRRYEITKFVRYIKGRDDSRNEGKEGWREKR